MGKKFGFYPAKAEEPLKELIYVQLKLIGFREPMSP